MSETSDLSPERPVAAQYIVNFLKPEMLHVYRQVTALRAFRPIVFCQKREQAAAFPFENVVLLPKPRTHQLRRFWQKTVLRRPITIYQSEAQRTMAALQQAGARVLHVYFGHIGVHLLPLLERCSLPVIVSFHGADTQEGTPAHEAARRRMFERCTLVLARSESLAHRLIALGCDPQKLRIHRAGIPLEMIAFHPREAPADGAWKCLQACRLIEKKGLVTSLRAFAEFAREFPRATFTIAGDGPELGKLQAIVHEEGLDDRVVFTGFVTQEQLQQLFRSAHFFLHPSESTPGGDQEGVPNALLEAMASGLPVLATRHGGIPEAIEQDVSGVLVDEGDSPALARHLLQLARAPDHLETLSTGGRARVCAAFGLQAQTRILEQYYDEALRLYRTRVD